MIKKNSFTTSNQVKNTPGKFYIIVKQDMLSWKYQQGEKPTSHLEKKYEATINLNQNGGRCNSWSKTYNIIRQTSWKHVMTWPCMTAGPLMFPDDVTAVHYLNILT